MAGTIALAGVLAVLVVDNHRQPPLGYAERPLERIEIVPAAPQPSLEFPTQGTPVGRELAALRLDLSSATPPSWLRHAVAVPPADGRAMIAIVIDDVGLSRRLAERAVALPAPLTLALLSYAEALPELAQGARAAGHELLVHVAMEPVGDADPGPRPLLSTHSDDELRRRLVGELARFSGYVGVNNHMGSRLTADPRAMAAVMAELKAQGLMFLDSRTTPVTVAAQTARAAGVPTVERDIFLDNEQDPTAIRAALAAVEARALSQGFAIAIGHPHEATLDALAEWLPAAQARGFRLVPISFLVGRTPRHG